MLEHNKVYNEDCFTGLLKIDDKSIDFIFTDLPYNKTANHWDYEIDLEKLWKQYKRIIKPNGCIALWSQAPFSHRLACSNMDWYRYEWVIEKTRATGHLNAKKMPMKAHENVLIFYEKLPTYNPHKTSGHAPVHSYTKHKGDGSNYGQTYAGISGGGSTERYPRDVLTFKWDTRKESLHPCQKPLEACKYFIKTYTNPGDLVLDSCAGSCTTALAALETRRQFICFEKDKEIFNIGRNRILDTYY